MKEGNLRKIYFLITSLFLFGGTIISFVVFLEDVFDLKQGALTFRLEDYVLENFFALVIPFLLLFILHFGIFWNMTKGEK